MRVKRVLPLVTVLMCGSASAIASEPFTSEPYLELREPEPILDHWFGFAMASAGNEVLISSIDYIIPGEVHLFDVQTGSLLQTFSGPAGLPVDAEFGFALAIDGDDVFVAATYASTTFTGDGTVFRFDRVAGGLPEASYISPEPGELYHFGSAMAVGRGRLFVGEPYAGGTGAVHVYDLASGSTVPTQTLSKPMPVGGEEFGADLSVVGDVLVVGAPRDTVSMVNQAGAVYLFNADTGEYLQTLSVNPPAAFERFGSSVGGTTTKILAGAPLFPDAGGDRPGAAYLFEGDRNSAQFGQLLHRLDNPTPANLDRFGHTVACVGDYLLVGAIWDDTGAPDAGTAYLFDQDGTLVQTFQKPVPADDDWFSWGLASAGGNVLIGATLDDDGSLTDVGAAYLFGNTPTGAMVEAGVTSDDGTEISLTFDQVNVAGVTTAEQVECPPVPGESTFSLCDPPICQDITTTAVFEATQDEGIRVCISYDGSGCPAEGGEESDIRLYHDRNRDGTLEDITETVIPEDDIVCGITSHLSLFEVVLSDLDGDGVPDALDACSMSDLRETVVIGQCDSGVQNSVSENGCSISDLIAQWAEENCAGILHVSCIVDAVNDLASSGMVSDLERGALIDCAGP